MNDCRREQLVDFVEKEFIGPDPIDWHGLQQLNGEEILITDPPRTRYIAGILYPSETTEIDTESNTNASEPIYECLENDFDPTPEKKTSTDMLELLENAEELINRSNAYRQSAISLTVAIKNNDSIRVKVTAGIYKTIIKTDPETTIQTKTYERHGLFWENQNKPLELPNNNIILTKTPVDDTGLQFDAAFRYTRKGCTIYTFTLENIKQKSGLYVRDEDCFFQVKFHLLSEKGFAPLAASHKITEDEDYQSNLLLYRNVHNYAIGHGCSANWDDESEIIDSISTAIFPKYDVKPIVPNTSIAGVNLSMLNMSQEVNFSYSIFELRNLCKQYGDWINKLEEVSKTTLDSDYKATATRHIENCKTCLARIKNGVDLLEKNKNIRIAFQYMNLAMLMQQLHYNLPLQRWVDDGENDIKLLNPVNIPIVNNADTWFGNKDRYGKWRPFQLAFILMNLESMYKKDSKERSLVDLIWFPTGGGKTEAYLGLSAFTIFIRRLLDKNDDGLAILMRYTLRLLTAQQYERASAMICACEVIREEHQELFGQNQISIGLWVGASTTPNTVADAISAYNNLYKGEGNNPFVILKCPWCGAQMGPVQKSKNQWALPGYKKVTGPRRSFKFTFRCYNDNCYFSKKDLPLDVIDESIYKNPPTLLLGTVDKFAMLPFRPQAQSLFGYVNGKKRNSPDLIIQDELHLISGPLGSMVGHYETLINELCTTRTESGDIHPKIITSTATISKAKEQCHALYACDRNQVFQFPPSGLDAGDSFFAKEDKSQNGRRYVGILASGSSSDATTAIRLFAALLYGTKALKVSDEKERDPYWTNIGYYNSIRELGQAATWIRADIDQHLDVIYKRRFDDKRYETKEIYRRNRRYIWRDEELTSRISGNEVTASLTNLGISYPPIVDADGKIREHPIDICLATNMISVGLDVPRLGLMTVAGQPKTTSEYIQATSRVGRNTNDAPGIVFVLYRPGRPRDKSHYEHFRSYHSQLYCNVEPTSVTPFSSPVRDRALHAIMIAMMRLESSDDFNNDPPKIPDKELYTRVRNIIENRVSNIDNEELDATLHRIEYIMQCWEDWGVRKWEPERNQDWSYGDSVPLMYAAGSYPNVAWDNRGIETPTSMRSVDASCEAEVLNNRYVQKEN